MWNKGFSSYIKHGIFIFLNASEFRDKDGQSLLSLTNKKIHIIPGCWKFVELISMLIGLTLKVNHGTVLVEKNGN